MAAAAPEWSEPPEKKPPPARSSSSPPPAAARDPPGEEAAPPGEEEAPPRGAAEPEDRGEAETERTGPAGASSPPPPPPGSQPRLLPGPRSPTAGLEEPRSCAEDMEVEEAGPAARGETPEDSEEDRQASPPPRSHRGNTSASPGGARCSRGAEEEEDPGDGTPAMDDTDCSSDVEKAEAPQMDSSLIEDISDEDAVSTHKPNLHTDAEKGAVADVAGERNGEGVDGKEEPPKPSDAEKSLVKDKDAVGDPRTDAVGGKQTLSTDAEKSTRDKDAVRGPEGGAAAEEMEADEEEEAEGVVEDEEDSPVKQRKSRLQCQECGMKFSRREMYNLHRYSHAHQDELDPLTCRECGQTFQQRSSLIKHRSEHREKEEQQHIVSPPPSREVRTLSFKCATCEKFFSSVQRLRSHHCGSGGPEKPYLCPLCRQEFLYKNSLTVHMQHHSLESVFACQECHQSFSDSAALRQHQRCHAALKPYECPDCGMAFKYYSLMEDHRRKHWENMPSHRCGTCGKSFKYSSLLQQHQYLHTGQKPFRCPDCGRTFAFAQNMKAHCRQHRIHGPVLPLSSAARARKQASATAHEKHVRGPGKENAGQVMAAVAVPPKRAYNCPLCPQVCHSPADLRGHMQIHEAEFEALDNAVLSKETTPMLPAEGESKRGVNWEEGYTCPHCPSTFRDEPMLFGHLLRAHNSSAHYLKQMRPESGQPGTTHKVVNLSTGNNVKGKWRPDAASSKTYKCPECTKTFRHRSVLELHMRIHSKDKPYRCKECGKSFRFSSYLQQHQIIHTGKKPYKCPDCGKDFAFLQNMRTHQKLHQEKPYRCNSCRKGYSDEEQLRQHMLSHAGDKPHKCHLCDKSFALAYLLRDHMNTHTGERPHRCEDCHKSFSWFTSLLVHQKIHTRKRQGYGPYGYSFSSGLRTRGRGSPVRGPGRPRLALWSQSRPAGELSSSAALGPQQQHPPPPPPYPVPSLREHEWQNLGPNHGPAAQQTPMFPPAPMDQMPLFPAQMDQLPMYPAPMDQTPLFPPQGDLQDRQQKEGPPPHPLGPPPHPLGPPVQWKVDGVETKSQEGGGQTESGRAGWASPPDPASIHSLEPQDNTAGVPKRPSPPALSDAEQQPQSDVVPPPSSASSTSSLPHLEGGSALWSVRPAHAAPASQGSELHLPNWSSTAANAAASAQKPASESPPSPTSSASSAAAPKKDDGSSGELGKPQTGPPAAAASQSEKPGNGGVEPQKRRPSLPDPAVVASTSSAQADQSGGMSGSSSNPWDLHSIPKTLSSMNNVVGAPPDFQLQQKAPQQLPSGWVNLPQAQAAPQVPFSIAYEPPRFPPPPRGAMGPVVWGFQTRPPHPQGLLSGPLRPPGSTAAAGERQPNMVTGTQILINQPSPFFSPPLAPLPPLHALPGSHPLHSVAVGAALARHPQPNIFFAPQAVLGGDRAPLHLPHHHHQALSLPQQLAMRTDPHKVGGAGGRLPFAPERLLQCMICGGSLPSELDLQVHYMQHAQGKI